MSVRAKCPIHEHALEPDLCAGCSIAIIAADAMNGVMREPVEPKRTFVDVRGLREDGTGVIVWNQSIEALDS